MYATYISIPVPEQDVSFWTGFPSRTILKVPDRFGPNAEPERKIEVWKVFLAGNQVALGLFIFKILSKALN